MTTFTRDSNQIIIEYYPKDNFFLKKFIKFLHIILLKTNPMTNTKPINLRKNSFN